MEGLRVWVTTLIEYDKYGNGTVLRSFAKPAADSKIKGLLKVKGKVANRKAKVPEVAEEKELW